MSNYKFATKSIHSGQQPDETTGAIMTPIYATSTYVQQAPGINKGYEYSRSKNPTRFALEQCIADLESGKRGYAFSSGLAACSTIIDLLPKDSHIISINDLYGGSFRLFEKVKKITAGISVDYTNFNSEADVLGHIKENTKMIWVESPTNPLLKIVDLKKISSIAKKHGIITVCDNTFATPFIQRPLEYGFDIVVHSATKYINGHSDVIAGVAVVGENEDLQERLYFLQNATGAILSPFDSFLVLRGIKTLAIRVKEHSINAQKVAEFLEEHPNVGKVIYPGLKSHPQYEFANTQMKLPGGMVTFLIKGGIDEANSFLQKTKLFSLAESLGGVESLVEHPASMTHASIPKDIREGIGIYDNLIRLSVGIEDIEDLIQDLKQALE